MMLASGNIKNTGLFILSSVLLLIAVVWSAAVGTADVSVKDILKVIGAGLFPFLKIESSEFAHTVFLH